MKDTKQAPAAQQVTVVLDQLSYVSISDLRIASWNARKTIDTEELKSSIATHGIQVPLIVRMTLGGACEIVAGHRRFNAALALWEKGDERFDKLPCIVRELNDDQAREIGMVDNLQREDVPALEEADAYAELQQRLGTPAAIAARVGKDVAYVARRLQLCSLADSPRKALAERLISVDHALLLARLGVDEQDANLKWALNPNSGIKESVEETIKQRIQERDRKEVRYSGYWEPQSVLDLKHHIEQNVGRRLSRAPWSLDDATLLQDVPACNNCPSNTKHNDTLFGDLNISAATCENGLCFMAKRTAFVELKLSDATTKQDAGRGPAVRLSWKETTVKPRFSEAKAGTVTVDESGVNLMQTFKRGQWIEAKPKSCAFVRVGVTVDWSDANDRGYMGGGEKPRKPGQQLTVCIAPGCKAHRKEWEKPKSENRNAPYNAKAEEEKREKRRLAALAETKLRTRIAGDAIDRVKTLHLGMLREILIGQIPNGRNREIFNAILPDFETILRAEKIDSVKFARAVALLNVGGNVSVWEHFEANQDRKEFIADMKRVGYDASKAWDKPAEPKAAKPEKKSILSAAAKKRIAEAQKKRWAAAAKKKGGRK